MGKKMRLGPVELVGARVGLPDKTWLRFRAEPEFGPTAAWLAREHVSSPQAVAFLTKSLLLVNQDALRRGNVAESMAWVPDRETGEVKFYGHVNSRVLGSAQEATAEVYARRDPQKDIGRKVVVYSHSTTTLGCPAGQCLINAWTQRHRGNALTELCTEVLVFPPVADCWEAWCLFLAGTEGGVAEQIGHFARFFAMDVELTVRFPDGSTQDFPARPAAPQQDA